MTNFNLLIHMPTRMHMPEMCVYTQQWLVQRPFFFFLTLGRRVVVWTGNRSQRRSSQERKDNGRKTDSRRDSNESRRSTRNGATVSCPPPNPIPTPSPFPPMNHLVSTPGAQNSYFPSVPCPIYAQPLQTSPLQTPWKSQKSPSPRLNHRRPKAAAGGGPQRQVPLALQPRAKGSAHPPLPRTSPGQPPPSSARLHTRPPRNTM